MNPDFGRLEELSKTLNQSSDELTKHLSEIQSKLQDLNLGLKVWVENPPIYKKDLGDRQWEFAYLGYGKTGMGKWALLVKTTVETEPADAEYDPWKTESIFAIRPLLEASRHLKVAAVDEIESLFEVLEEEAERVSTAVTKAAELASK